MEFDENKKLEVEVSTNEFVENRVVAKRRRKHSIDFLDVAIVPVVIGVFVSLGFLFANIFKASATMDAMRAVATFLTNI